MALEMQVMTWDRHKNVAWLNQLLVMRSNTPPLIINLQQRYRCKQTITDSFKCFSGWKVGNEAMFGFDKRICKMYSLYFYTN
jgi:hypothetical protein